MNITTAYFVRGSWDDVARRMSDRGRPHTRMRSSSEIAVTSRLVADWGLREQAAV